MGFLSLLLWFLALPALSATYPLEEDVVGEIQTIRARYEDTLPDIARRFDLGYDELVRVNPGVDPWLPGEGTEIVLPTQFVLPRAPREGIVLNLPEMRLYYYPPGGREVVTYPVGIGREGWDTPLGKTRIVARVANPSWYPPASIRKEHEAQGDPLPKVVPPGPDNPLGDFALRLGFPGYLIHGTNKPYGIGMRVSHGCIRLYPEDIAELFSRVKVGTPVHIIDQPYKAGWKEGKLYLEAHPPLKERESPYTPVVETLVIAQGERQVAIDWDKALKVAEEALGWPVVVSVPEEEKAPAKAKRMAAVEGGWFVQAGAFTDPDAAQRMVEALQALDPPIPARRTSLHGVHQVIAGPFAEKQKAQQVARRMVFHFRVEPRIFQ
ncbi:MAG: L,D-transpeptidase [Gammaproteobacteria bacterium]|nr:MAG: L,D-transpeptidase [Gammaproteobacteria bacterium]